MRSGDGSGTGSGRKAASGVIVAEGFVRVADDTDSDLRVTLMVMDEQVVLMSNLVEIGAWPLPTVEITRAYPGRFDLTIGDESIGFFPDEPKTFADLPIVSAQSRKGRRKARRQQRVESEPPAVAEPAEPSSEPPEPRRERPHVKRSSSPTHRASGTRAPKRETRGQQRRARKAAKKAARLEKPTPPRKAPKARPRRARKSRVAPLASATTRKAAEKLKPRLIRARWRVRMGWYWILDELRDFDDGFPWNRIPMISDEKRQEPGHVHSFEARKAPAGIIRQICSCGKIRLESRAVELEGPVHLRSQTSENATPD